MKKYTLPRHTNLASQGLRITSAVVDFAIALALTLLFYFAGANLILNKTTSHLNDELINYQVDSHLKVRNEDGSVVIVNYTDPTVEKYEDALQAFYLRYLPGNGLEGEAVAPNVDKPLTIDGNKVMPKDYYTVRYYNETVLGISQDNPDGEMSTSYFTYQKDEEGNFLKDELAIRRTSRYDPETGKVKELTDTDFLAEYGSIYVRAYNVLVVQDFYQNTANTYYFYYTLGIAASIFLAGIITYIVIPYFLKNGQTLGKKAFKLGLANYDGYKMESYRLLLRFVPAFIVIASLLIPIWSTIFLAFIIPIVVGLVSFALMMASPKKAALHDYAARTIVIDLASSTLFENEIEEEAYIAREDGLDLTKGDENGEEPELRYER